MEDDFKSMLYSLDTEQQHTVLMIARAAVRAISSENGAMLVIYDTEGEGNAMLLSCGNQFIVGPMLATAQEIGKRFYADTPEVVQ